MAIENLVSSIRLKAGGRIPAMMKEEFSNAALNTISRVGDNYKLYHLKWYRNHCKYTNRLHKLTKLASKPIHI